MVSSPPPRWTTRTMASCSWSLRKSS
jgi:hypothetical protein